MDAQITLRVCVPELNVTKVVQFKMEDTITDAIANILDKIPNNIQTEKIQEYGLYIQDESDMNKGLYLDPKHTLYFYSLQNMDTVFFQNKMRIIRVKMMDGTLKTIMVDESQNVENIIKVIADRVSVQNWQEYSLSVDAPAPGTDSAANSAISDAAHGASMFSAGGTERFKSIRGGIGGNATLKASSMAQSTMRPSSTMRPNNTLTPAAGAKSSQYNTMSKNEQSSTGKSGTAAPSGSTLSHTKSTIARKYEERDKKRMEKLKQKLRTDDELNWLLHEKTLTEQGIDPNQLLIFRRKYFYEQNENIKDPMELNLLYSQCRDGILGGTIICNLEESIKFAALQAQIEYGDYNQSKYTSSTFDIKNFFPEDQHKNLSKSVEKQMTEQHRNLSGLSAMNAKYRYATNVQNLATYGISVFLVKERIEGKQKLGPVLLGITKENIMRMDDKTKEVLHTYPLTSVRRWAAANNCFTLDFGDYSDSLYSVMSSEAEKIAQLISGYIEIILKKRREKEAEGIDYSSAAVTTENVSGSQGMVFKKGGVGEGTVFAKGGSKMSPYQMQFTRNFQGGFTTDQLYQHDIQFAARSPVRQMLQNFLNPNENIYESIDGFAQLSKKEQLKILSDKMKLILCERVNNVKHLLSEQANLVRLDELYDPERMKSKSCRKYQLLDDDELNKYQQLNYMEMLALFSKVIAECAVVSHKPDSTEDEDERAAKMLISMGNLENLFSQLNDAMLAHADMNHIARERGMENASSDANTEKFLKAVDFFYVQLEDYFRSASIKDNNLLFDHEDFMKKSMALSSAFHSMAHHINSKDYNKGIQESLIKYSKVLAMQMAEMVDDAKNYSSTNNKLLTAEEKAAIVQHSKDLINDCSHLVSAARMNSASMFSDQSYAAMNALSVSILKSVNNLKESCTLRDIPDPNEVNMNARSQMVVSALNDLLSCFGNNALYNSPETIGLKNAEDIKKYRILDNTFVNMNSYQENQLAGKYADAIRNARIVSSQLNNLNHIVANSGDDSGQVLEKLNFLKNTLDSAIINSGPDNVKLLNKSVKLVKDQLRAQYEQLMMVVITQRLCWASELNCRNLDLFKLQKVNDVDGKTMSNIDHILLAMTSLLNDKKVKEKYSIEELLGYSEFVVGYVDGLLGEKSKVLSEMEKKITAENVVNLGLMQDSMNALSKTNEELKRVLDSAFCVMNMNTSKAVYQELFEKEKGLLASQKSDCGICCDAVNEDKHVDSVNDILIKKLIKYIKMVQTSEHSFTPIDNEKHSCKLHSTHADTISAIYDLLNCLATSTNNKLSKNVTENLKELKQVFNESVEKGADPNSYKNLIMPLTTLLMNITKKHAVFNEVFLKKINKCFEVDDIAAKNNKAGEKYKLTLFDDEGKTQEQILADFAFAVKDLDQLLLQIETNQTDAKNLSLLSEKALRLAEISTRLDYFANDAEGAQRRMLLNQIMHRVTAVGVVIEAKCVNLNNTDPNRSEYIEMSSLYSKDLTSALFDLSMSLSDMLAPILDYKVGTFEAVQAYEWIDNVLMSRMNQHSVCIYNTVNLKMAQKSNEEVFDNEQNKHLIYSLKNTYTAVGQLIDSVGLLAVSSNNNDENTRQHIVKMTDNLSDLSSSVLQYAYLLADEKGEHTKTQGINFMLFSKQSEKLEKLLTSHINDTLLNNYDGQKQETLNEFLHAKCKMQCLTNDMVNIINAVILDDKSDRSPEQQMALKQLNEALNEFKNEFGTTEKSLSTFLTPDANKTYETNTDFLRKDIEQFVVCLKNLKKIAANPALSKKPLKNVKDQVKVKQDILCHELKNVYIQVSEMLATIEKGEPVNADAVNNLVSGLKNNRDTIINTFKDSLDEGQARLKAVLLQKLAELQEKVVESTLTKEKQKTSPYSDKSIYEILTSDKNGESIKDLIKSMSQMKYDTNEAYNNNVHELSVENYEQFFYLLDEIVDEFVVKKILPAKDLPVLVKENLIRDIFDLIETSNAALLEDKFNMKCLVDLSENALNELNTHLVGVLMTNTNKPNNETTAMYKNLFNTESVKEMYDNLIKLQKQPKNVKLPPITAVNEQIKKLAKELIRSTKLTNKVKNNTPAQQLLQFKMAQLLCSVGKIDVSLNLITDSVSNMKKKQNLSEKNNKKPGAARKSIFEVSGNNDDYMDNVLLNLANFVNACIELVDTGEAVPQKSQTSNEMEMKKVSAEYLTKVNAAVSASEHLVNAVDNKQTDRTVCAKLLPIVEQELTEFDSILLFCKGGILEEMYSVQQLNEEYESKIEKEKLKNNKTFNEYLSNNLTIKSDKQNDKHIVEDICNDLHNFLYNVKMFSLLNPGENVSVLENTQAFLAELNTNLSEFINSDQQCSDEKIQQLVAKYNEIFAKVDSEAKNKQSADTVDQAIMHISDMLKQVGAATPTTAKADVDCSAENLTRLTKEITLSTTKMLHAYKTNKLADIEGACGKANASVTNLVNAVNGFTHSNRDLLAKHNNSESDINSAVKNLCGSMINMLDDLKTKVNDPAAAANASNEGELLNSHSKNITNSVVKFVKIISDLKDKELGEEDASVVAEQELMNAAAAIEAAAKKLAEMQPIIKKKTETTSTFDPSLNFSEQIVAAATAITKAASILVTAATEAQRELVANGVYFGTDGNKKSDGQWSEGLISAARLVAESTGQLCEAADESVKGTASKERLIASANAISYSTVQLVMACKVKADENSAGQKRLQSAATAIKKATRNLIDSVEKTGIFDKDEQEDNNKAAGAGPTNKISERKKELEAMEEILKKERELNAARDKLFKLRKGQS